MEQDKLVKSNQYRASSKEEKDLFKTVVRPFLRGYVQVGDKIVATLKFEYHLN